MGVALAILVAATSHLAASPIDTRSTDEFNRLVFSTPLSQFVAAADRREPAIFDWSTDLCSAPLVGNSGGTFDFGSACRRHDFAYRNAKKIPGLWNSSSRHKIDLQFRRDMSASCGKRPLVQRLPCRAWAEIYYQAVRIAGGP